MVTELVSILCIELPPGVVLAPAWFALNHPIIAIPSADPSA